MTQEIINIGAVANDRLGDTWRDAFDKTNDNFTELYTSGGIFNVVKVNSLADFPDPVGGVIELIPNPGDSIVYLIGALDVDIGTNRFTVTGGDIVIRGIHRTASNITTSNPGDMFTCVDGSFFNEYISFTCAAGRWLNFSNPSAGIKSVANQNVIIRACDEIATISGAFVTSLRVFTVVSATTSGFTFTGTANGQLNMSNFLGLNWGGALIDLGTATFNLIDLSANNRFISPAGTTILSIAPASANLTATGRGLVSGNIFNGLGTAIGGGGNTLDLQWEFKSNIFADGTTQNSRQLADAFLTAPETVTINTIGVYEPIAGNNWQADITDRFSVAPGGIATYIGLSTIDVEILVFSTVEKVGGGSNVIGSKIAINGVVQDKTIGTTQNTTPTGVSSVGLFTMATGDTMQIFVGNEDSTSNIIVSQSTALVKGG